MRVRGLVTISVTLALWLLTACTKKPTGSAVSDRRDFSAEALNQAEHVFSLIYAHCGDSYYRAESIRAIPVSDLKTNARPRLPLTSEDKFFGYEWKGMIEITSSAGSGEAFEIFRRAGKWYFKPQREESIPIGELQSVAPSCEAATARAETNRNRERELAIHKNPQVWVESHRPLTFDWRKVSPVGPPCTDISGTPAEVSVRNAGKACSVAVVYGNGYILFLNWTTDGDNGATGIDSQGPAPSALDVLDAIHSHYGPQYVIRGDG